MNRDCTFTVQVDHTDRTRTTDGGFVTFTTTVDVLTDTDTDAHLCAAQLVGAIRDNDGHILDTRIVSVCA